MSVMKVIMVVTLMLCVTIRLGPTLVPVRLDLTVMASTALVSVTNIYKNTPDSMVQYYASL